jgi:acetylglutamate kinase
MLMRHYKVLLGIMLKAIIAGFLLSSSIAFVNSFTFSGHISRSVFRNLCENNFDFETDELTSNDASFISIKSADQSLSSNINSSSIFSADDLTGSQFGLVFTQCAPYIAQHRGSIMVIHIPSKLFFKQNRETFDAIMDDISILHLLGIQLVLVAGVRDLVDQRIVSETQTSIVYHDGMRVTDEITMHYLKELSGFVRFEVESSLGRGFRGTASVRGVQVISGNFFYSAKPVGVRNGTDFKLTGEVRRIEVDNFKKRLESGDIVLLTSLGHSHSGEVFHVPSELLAAECASKLKASKIIYLTGGEQLVDTRTNKVIQSLRLAQAASLLSLIGMNQPVSSSPVEAEPSVQDSLAATVSKTDASVDMKERQLSIKSPSIRIALRPSMKHRKKSQELPDSSLIVPSLDQSQFVLSSELRSFVHIVARYTSRIIELISVITNHSSFLFDSFQDVYTRCREESDVLI